MGQYEKKRPVDKGPRALALVQLASNGKAHLVPIAIMIDGQFYDAGAYKADPVPMALQSDTVYEAQKTGTPEGLFTVSGALPGKNGWTGVGKWQPQTEIDAQKAKAKAAKDAAAKSAHVDEDIGGPPKLKRAPGSDSDSKSSQPSPTPVPTSGGSSPASTGASPSAAPASSAPSSSDDAHPKLTRRDQDQRNEDKRNEDQTPASAGSSPDNDPNRPILRHQTAADTTHEQTKPGNEEPLTGPLDFIPAISDAGGPEPRPYAYQLKPDEEQALLKKMLAMAGEEVKARAAHLAGEGGEAKPASSKITARKAKTVAAPQFHNPQLRVFDLSSTNEPVLVLTAEAKISTAPDLDFIVALVARQDIYGDLHKAFAQTTDDKHLDVLPRYDLIDAVDADGDGVGELLFKQTWDSGQAYSVYRVIGDQLWPLFEGKPGT